MIVFCEDCGKKYKIDLEKMKGDSASFKCKKCNYNISVTRPAKVPKKPLDFDFESEESEFELSDELSEDTRTYEDLTKVKGMGLRTKMLLLFFLAPILIIAGSGVLYIWQLNTLATVVSSESASIVKQIAEDMIVAKSRAVAKQCKIFLDNNPELGKEQFFNSAAFMKIAVQSVGKTGYTALYEQPGGDNIWRTWAHKNPKIIGIDMMKLKKPLGENFDGFWDIYTAIKNNTESRGYYTWKDQNGEFRDKFMVSTHVPGTAYIVSATTYIDEFTRPVKLVQEHAEKIAENAKYTMLAIIAGTMVLVGLTVILYGNHLIRRISHLTNVTNRISMGEMDAQLVIDSTDELGVLAVAIERMQESIRMSIERLRRKRI